MPDLLCQTLAQVSASGKWRVGCAGGDRGHLEAAAARLGWPLARMECIAGPGGRACFIICVEWWVLYAALLDERGRIVALDYACAGGIGC